MDYGRINGLAAKAKGGDMVALEELCKEKSQSVLYHAMKNLGNRHDAQEAAQEALIRMCRGIGALRDPTYFNAWMQRIVLTTCYEFQRKRRMGAERSRAAVDESALIETDRDAIPHTNAEDTDSREMLRRIVSALPEKRRSAILMYYYDDMSYAQIAEAMGVTVGTVSTNIMKAKASIKRTYEQYERNEEKRREEREQRAGKMRAGMRMRYADGTSAGLFMMLPDILRDEASFMVSRTDVELLMESLKPVISAMKTAAATGGTAGIGGVPAAVGSHGSAATIVKLIATTVLISATASTAALAAIDPNPTLIVPAPVVMEVAKQVMPDQKSASGQQAAQEAGASKEPTDAVLSNGGIGVHVPVPAEQEPPVSNTPATTEPALATPAPITEEPAVQQDLDLAIEFVGGDCGCGHVNPDEAVISYKYGDANPAWSIIEEGGTVALYTGSGGNVNEPLEELAAQKREGAYVLVAVVTDSGGGRVWETSRGFLILP